MAHNQLRGTVETPATVRDDAGSVPPRWRGDPLWSLAAAEGLSPEEILDVLAGLDRDHDEDDDEETCLAGACGHEPGDPRCEAFDFFDDEDEDEDDEPSWVQLPPQLRPLLWRVR